jgi:hypothetical protein
MQLSIDDIIAIHHLYANYSHSFDFGTPDEFAAIFTEDGELETSAGVSRGHKQLAKGVSWAREHLPGIRHGTMNVIVDGEGDEAQGSSYLLVYQAVDGAITLLQSGRYQDSFRKVGGEWRFLRRVMTGD